ncbi:MAG: TrmH family RNA methyltransferase [Candidatus Levybacteria bacterium]|nr:TrmH family RNA methyltransferase [Candidatus Levybacteria bacterium]
MIKLGAKDLRTTKGNPRIIKKLPKNPIYIIVDNVLDTYNVGAIFRLADATAAEEVILCGETETPPHTRIKKASINTTQWVKWEYKETALDAIKSLRKEVPNIYIVSVELDKRAVLFNRVEYKFPVALVVGHESNGVSKEVLNASDLIVQLPMFGVNKSLNVMVSLGIVLYQVIEKIKK